jgi:hypothetical protein
MVLATDSIGMGILLDKQLARSLAIEDEWGNADDPVGFSSCYETFHSAIHAEVGTTGLIRAQGYEISVMMAAFLGASDHEGRPATIIEYCEENKYPLDVLYDGAYFGTNVHPYELVFYKANRGVSPATLDGMTKWHLKMNRNSWDTCR